MTSLFSGAILDRTPGPRYSAALPFAELAFKKSPPRLGTLAKWRKGAPTGLTLALDVPASATSGPRGPLRPDPTLDEAVTWTLKAQNALRASFLVLTTPSDLTTGQRDRDLLRDFVGRLRAAKDCKIVWAPTGLWEPEEAAAFARKLEMIYAFDPLDTTAPEGDVSYARIRTLGGRPRITENMWARIIEQIAESEAEAFYVAIDSPRSYEDARRLQSLLRAAMGAAAEEEEDEEGDDEEEDEEDDDVDVDEDEDEEGDEDDDVDVDEDDDEEGDDEDEDDPDEDE